MISCQKCLHDNPLGTTFCHQCGTRLVVNLAVIERSVMGSRKEQFDDRVLQAGLSAISLSFFALIAALILRFSLVPTMPPLELPSPVLGSVFPEAPPAWTSRALTTAEAPAAAALPKSPRLAWRQLHAGSVLLALGIGPPGIVAWQSALLAAQQADGSVAAADPLAATALTAAALQAAPLSPAGISGAARARAWLIAHSDRLTQLPSLTRTLVALALMDADELSEVQLGALSIYLVDGAAPLWQAYLLTLYPNAQRPTSHPSLNTAWTTGVATDFFALMAGTPQVKDRAAYRLAALPATGEERLLWAVTGWNNPAMPLDLRAALHACSIGDPPPVSSDLTHACGTTAPIAVAILTVCAPLHVPPLWLYHTP